MRKMVVMLGVEFALLAPARLPTRETLTSHDSISTATKLDHAFTERLGARTIADSFVAADYVGRTLIAGRPGRPLPSRLC